METLQKILFIAPVLLFSVIAHEIAHGYAALKQGDTTAYQLGRLSWNPVKHIDPVLTILMPLVMGYASNWEVMLGGAKPVPVNPRNYRNYKRGDIIVSLAGVITNLIIAIGCVIVIALLGLLARAAPAIDRTVGILQVMMIYGFSINFGLIVFNLMPIPPLDGSHVMKYLLPPAWSLRYQEIAKYGFIILIALLYFGQGVLNLWMTPAYLASGLSFAAVNELLLPYAFEWFR